MGSPLALNRNKRIQLKNAPDGTIIGTRVEHTRNPTPPANTPPRGARAATIFQRMTHTTETPSLSHLDETGQARMVDVGHKNATQRSATAQAQVTMGETAWRLLSAQANSKGEVLNTARIAGVLAAKRCAELIPLCHSLPLSFAGVDFELDEPAHTITVRATCKTSAQTGVEMEALTACSVAALTIYDRCKAADKGIRIDAMRLIHKSGGKSGEWHAS